ncbi:MAG: enoyl-CoA hydratase [Gammaproteobacteria bacterium]
MSESLVQYEGIGAVARIWLDRPDKSNAQNTAMLDALDAAIRRAAADEAIRVVVLAGRGRHFSAGHDHHELGADYMDLPTETRYLYEERHYYGYAMAIRDLAKPVIAQVQGAAIAGGFMLAAVCDLIVASEDAYFADPVVHFGAPGIEVQLHAWVLGDRLARDMLYTGRRVGAEEAQRAGFVSRIVPAAELEAATLALAQRIAEAPAFSLKLTKRSLNRTQDIQGFRVAAEATFDTHQLAHTVRSGYAGGDGAVQAMKSKISSAS